MSAAVFAQTGRAEWSRMWTVRSHLILAILTSAAVVGLGLVMGINGANDPSAVPADASAWRGTSPAVMFALFGVLALAVVTSAADHGTGGIVPSLQCTPRRGVLLAARVTVIVATLAMLGVVLIAAASLILHALVPQTSLSWDEGREHLASVAFVLAAAALLAVGLGMGLRSTAGGLVTVIALVLVLPPLLGNLPYTWAVDFSATLPGSNIIFLIFGEGVKDDMTVASSKLILAGWAVVSVAAGGWRLLRSDADK